MEFDVTASAVASGPLKLELVGIMINRYSPLLIDQHARRHVHACAATDPYSLKSPTRLKSIRHHERQQLQSTTLAPLRW